MYCMKNEAYYFHQTPETLCRELLKHIPDLDPTATVFEPFAGEGAWVRSFPETQNIIQTEIEYGKDYTSVNLEETPVDWVITNPPFCLDVEGSEKRENAFYKLADYFAGKTSKGFAFLINEQCLSALTPPRLKHLYQEKGMYVYKMVVCNVKKWRGRYYFVIFKNRCCIACKKKKEGCCPKLTAEQKAKMEAEHDEHEREEMKKLMKERFDFFDFVEGSF